MPNIGLLDGAMGSELIRRGETLPPYIWSADSNLSNPDLVYQIHKDYVEAGAQYLTANTFRTTPRAYEKIGLSIHDAEERAFLSLKSAIEIAKKADNGIQVLGSIAPLEDCYMPELFPGKKIAIKEFTQLGLWLKEAGSDAIILETMNSLLETLSALNAVSRLGLPVWVSFHMFDSKNICSGELLSDVIPHLYNYPVDCLLINCNNLNITTSAVDNIVDKWAKDWGVYPNLGIGNPSPNAIINKTYSNENFLFVIQKVVNAGASIIGGCCGSTPEHISLLNETFNVN